MTKNISAEFVKELRLKTGAGMMDCKKALQDSEGDVIKAIETLRKKGLASADKKSHRTTAEGLINTYIHAGSKIGVMIELNCETDFVARRPEFQELSKNLAMQIAACPQVSYIKVEDIPKDIIEQETKIEASKEDLIKKPEDVKGKIVEGRIKKRLEALSLMNQFFIRDTSITIENLIKQNIALMGENIQIKRFTKFILGESNN